jgi:5-carboxymethyl-2-hydroxymuconate isomerase
MPHIELKTTSNLSRALEMPRLLQELTDRLAEFETVTPAAIKAYHVPIENWVMGTGAPKGFAHCTVSVLRGRPEELRARMAEELDEIVRAALRPEILSTEASVTLELREMEPATYRK